MAWAHPWLLVAESERRGFEVVFKAELIGLAARMDIRGEGKGKLVTLSLWVNGERSVCWARSRIGGGGERGGGGGRKSAVAPLTFKCL